MIDLVLIVLVVLFVATALDLTTKKVPSVLLTGAIFIVALLLMVDAQSGVIHLGFGLVTFVFAYGLYEFGQGVADLKALTLVGLLVGNFIGFLIFLGLFVVIAFLYQVTCLWILKTKDPREIPYLPAIFITLIAMIIGGGFF